MWQYIVSRVYGEDLKANQAKKFAEIRKYCDRYVSAPITISQYRMLHCDSYTEQLKMAAKSTQTKFQDIVPLSLYHLNCNLSFQDLLELINLEESEIKSSNDLFHLLFQNSDFFLKSIYINQYSFNNPIPFYFPIIDTSFHESQFTICKELWYSLTPHNAIISFGLGGAANSAVGKSKLLDMLFEINFTESNPQSSFFHSNSIDLKLTKNFYPGDNCEKYFTDWAFFDCHTPTPINFINSLLKHVNILIVHVLESDLLAKFEEIEKELKSMNLKDKYIYIFIRDVSEKQKIYKVFKEIEYKIIKIPNLKEESHKLKLMKRELKEVGKELILLGNKIPKFTSKSLEELIKDYDANLWEEIEDSQKLVEDIIDGIISQRSSEGINYEFLSCYPIFIGLMKKTYQISSQDEQETVEKLNIQRSDCFKNLKNIQQCYVNEIFFKIISDKNCILILGKLVLELQRITNEVCSSNKPKQQANDKYSVEILWREAILGQKYWNKNSVSPGNEYFDKLSRSMCNLVQNGEPFELIDGDNLVFFSKELNDLLRHFHVRQTDFVQRYNKGTGRITEAPIVLSIIGPQSSGKSTLLNYVFGCKFITSSGRCTRGVYASVMELSEPINDSKFFLIIDTEGIEATEREEITNASNIHFDRTLILFCLSVSNIVIINLPGEIDVRIKELLKICAFSLNHLRVNRATLPKIIFVLNKVADPNLSKRKDALKILIKSLDDEIEDTKHSKKIKISDQINLTEADLYTLPNAFNTISVDTPAEEIFDKGVIKQIPASNFALECSKLRKSIFDQLKSSPTNNRPTFTSMSEWLSMAGGTWNSIIRFQDIVRYKDLNEVKHHEQLDKFVEELMESMIHSKEDELKKSLEKISNEISEMQMLKSSELKDEINKKTQDFENSFDTIKEQCLYKYAENAPDLSESRLIVKEHRSRLERLISTEKINYRIFLNTRTSEIYYQRKRKEWLDEFRKGITSNSKKFINFTHEQLNKEFEMLWGEKIENDDFEEIYRESDLQDFYLAFSNEVKLINQQEILEMYSQSKYNSDEIIKKMREKIVQSLTNLYEIAEPYFYPAKQCCPLKDIQPYFHSPHLEYLTENDFYYVHSTEGQESKYIRYFPNNKAIYKHAWVPGDCVPLLKSCSGYYPDHDIDWGYLSPNKQISKLIGSLMRRQLIQSVSDDYYQENTKYLYNISVPKIFKDLVDDVKRFMEKDPEMKPYTLKLIADAFQKRIDIFNHEIGYIGAELTLYACRNIASYIFSLAFRSYYSKKWELYLDNRKNIVTEKDKLKDYFFTKVEICKVIYCQNPSESDMNDIKISEKFGNLLLKNFKEKAKCCLIGATNNRLDRDREFFKYDSLVSEAEIIVLDAINKGENVENDAGNFIVQYYCNRNNALKIVFEKRWKEFIDSNKEEIIQEAIQKQQNMINELVEELEKLMVLMNEEDKSIFKADNMFQPLDNQDKEIDSFQLIESPYRTTILFLSMLMNPNINLLNFKIQFSKKFDYQGIRMRPCLWIIQDEKILNCIHISDVLFRAVQETKMFESEIIFNLYTYSNHFKRTLEQSKIQILDFEFTQYIDKNVKMHLITQSLGCTNKCPCCRKFCRQKFKHYGKCVTSGHQFASMGGKAWCNDKEHSALFFRCEDYEDDMVVALPGRLIKWGDFKLSSSRKWDWDRDLSADNLYKENTAINLIKVWDLFGREILKYHRAARITFRPYQENNSISSEIKFQICFVIDGTGSMATDIERVRISVQSIVNSYKKSNKLIEFRVVIYRDHCDANILEHFPKDFHFSTREEDIINFLGKVCTEGGGDVPEASLDGLAICLLANWERNDSKTRRIVVHLFDAPPHGDFPNYRLHHNNSNPDHCCCCSKLCKYDWDRDVWNSFLEKEIEYHGINTGDSNWIEFESTMSRKLDYLCKGFTKCGKEQVNDAVMQIFINYRDC